MSLFQAVQPVSAPRKKITPLSFFETLLCTNLFHAAKPIRGGEPLQVKMFKEDEMTENE